MRDDDFSALAGHDHLFHGLGDPPGVIRDEVTRALAADDPDAVVEAIALRGAPKGLTIARRDGEDAALVVTWFGVCLRARITRAAGYAREELDATLTLLLGGWDDPAQQRLRSYLDLGAAAERAFGDDVFRARLTAFRDAA